jgi:hypothetical protein
MKLQYLICLILCTLLTVGCDKLDDGDDTLVSEVLPGEWAFSYVLESAEETGLEFNYKQVIFRRDSTCAITYIDDYVERLDDKGNPVIGDDGEPVYDPVYGALNGKYQATSAMIRIESSVMGSEEEVMVWRIDRLSARQIVAEYDFEYAKDKYATAIVTLDKQ